MASQFAARSSRSGSPDWNSCGAGLRILRQVERLRGGIGRLALGLEAVRVIRQRLQPVGDIADVPALVVKRVFATVAQAGYPNVSFMVRKLPPG